MDDCNECAEKTLSMHKQCERNHISHDPIASWRWVQVVARIVSWREMIVLVRIGGGFVKVDHSVKVARHSNPLVDSLSISFVARGRMIVVRIGVRKDCGTNDLEGVLHARER
jgi:hypothetical protein